MKRRTILATFILLLLFLSFGCSSLIGINKSPRSPTSISKEIIKEINISNESPKFSIIESKENEIEWEVKKDKEKSLKFKHIKAKGDKEKHLIFIYNILKDEQQRIPSLIADSLVEEGFDCVIIEQEYFMSEDWTRPVISHHSNTVATYDEYTINLVRNVGRIIKYWLPKQKNLSGQYGFVGISMGGIHATMSAAIFSDSKITVAIMAGGDNVELFKNSTESLVIANREALLKDYEKNYPARDLYEDIANLKFRIFDLAKSVDTSKIKLIIAKYDWTVPAKCQWNLYYSLGKPETKVYPCGHYTLALYYFSVKWQIQKWVSEAFSVAN